MASPAFDPVTTSFHDAQREMCHVYYHGAPGALVSGLVWLMAAGVVVAKGPALAMWALFFGGIAIFPLSVALTKMLGRPGKHNPGNPLGLLAIASTFWMIMCIPLAFGVAMVRAEWFFPAMLLIIGGRYLTFATLYGGKFYWVFGATLGVAGWLLGKSGAAPLYGALAGGIIEIVFAGVLFWLVRGEPRGQSAAA